MTQTPTMRPAKPKTKPTAQRFADGRPKPAKVPTNDSAPVPNERRGCAICGENGGSARTVRDVNNKVMWVHIPTRNQAGDVLYGDCEATFEAQLKSDQIRAVKAQEDDRFFALALQKFGDNPPLGVKAKLEAIEQSRSMARNPQPKRAIFDCVVEGCGRFFDSDEGLQTHRRRAHKGTPTPAS